LKAIRNLIFDLDGTLIDSSEGVVEAVNYALSRMGQPAQDPQRIKAYIGYPLKDAFADFTRVPYVELYRYFQERALESVVSAAHPLTGVDKTLRELHNRGYRMAIATTKIKVHVDAIMSKFDWQPLFSATVGGNEVAAVKPDPAMFHLAIERLRTRPGEAVVIGDTENDVLAAQRVPMKVVAVSSPYGGNEKTLSLEPDYVIDSVSDLIALLDGNGL
jgi:pyrophosphatase PpaX